jgi:hypothetical protein
VLLGYVYFEEGQSGPPGLAERGPESVCPDLAEVELGLELPQAAPPPGEKASAGGVARAAEAAEDLEEQVIWKGTDPIHAVAVR